MREVRREILQYPSVTVCPSPPFKRKDGIKNFPSSSEAFEHLFKAEHKTKNNTFYFVNQPSKSNPGFPCMTTKNSYDPGKPCHFPFLLPPRAAKDENNVSIVKECIESEISNERFCATKVDQENMIILDNEDSHDSFGFCPPWCNGETMKPDSRFNLVKVNQNYYFIIYRVSQKMLLFNLLVFDHGRGVFMGCHSPSAYAHFLKYIDFIDLNFVQNPKRWHSDIYGFGALLSHCHTYNPPKDTTSSFDHGIAMFLGKKTYMNDTTDYAYFLFFHEKETFWTNKDVHNLISMKMNLNEQKTVIFRKVFHSILPKKETPCKNEAFSLTTCFKQFIEKKVGCSLDLFTTSTSFAKCDTMEKVNETLALLQWLQDGNFNNITKITGCSQRCVFDSYELVFEKNRKIDWRTSWNSELYVHLASDIVEERVEYLTFDRNAFISAIGGYLGNIKTMKIFIYPFYLN